MVGPKTEPKRPSRGPKSPSRTKSPGRIKSPGRTKKEDTVVRSEIKSPIRGRPKSTSRTKNEAKSKPVISDKEKTKSKSPSRSEPKEETKSKSKTGRFTPTRRSPIKKNNPTVAAVPVLKKKGTTFETDTDSDTALDDIGIKEKPKATVKGRSRSDIEKEANVSVEIGGGLLKRVTRSQNREVERIVHLSKQFELPVNKLGEFSDEDELLKKDQSVDFQRKFTVDWVGLGTNIFTLAVIISIPVCLAIALGTCTKDSCVATKIPKNLPTLLKPTLYYHRESVLAYLGYFILVVALSAIPIGFKVHGLPDKQGKLTYNANGIIIALLLVLITFGLEFRNIKVTDFITSHLFQLFVAALTAGFLTSIFAYIRSFYVPVSALNPKIIGKGRLEIFFWGKETHPRLFGRVDLKLLFARAALLGILLIDLAFIFNGVSTAIESQPHQLNATISSINLNLIRNARATPVLYFSLHLLYVLDSLYYEKQWLTSTLQQEGFGYNFAVLGSIIPFASALITKYIVEQQVNLATWQLVLAGVVGVFGLLYRRLCNRQRDGFLRNPYSPKFKRHEAISTSQGTKILASGFYTYVRFPHYLGDILITLSLVPFVLCATPVFALYASVLSFIYRTYRDDRLAKQKFGNAWERYCHKAKHLLLRKVF